MTPEVFQIQAVTVGMAILFLAIGCSLWGSIKGVKMASGAPFLAGLFFGTAFVMAGIAGLETAREWVNSIAGAVGFVAVIIFFVLIMGGGK